MLDFEEISFGHRDPTSKKYYPSINECHSPTMDLLLSANDSFSFQEMLDVDIKSEIDTIIFNNGGIHNDFSSFNFSELPPLELDDRLDDPTDINMWFSSNSNHSTSNFNIDFIGSEAAAMMVNPNSVMPLTLVTVPTKSTSPTISLAGRNIKSPSPTPMPVKTEQKPFTKIVSVTTDNKIKPIGKTIKISSPSINKKSLISTNTTTASIIAQSNDNIKTNNSNSVLNVNKNVQRLNMQNGAATTQTQQINMNGVRVVSRKQQFNRYSDDDKVYPKPAYSYSCLIAMALKNSRTGSLPVSEIYNFMCEHFPYFKTAPNGWKNSVRHNLSLNKCFEKIEKPAMSGAQRKGCLWAMNPSKIGKMDEEVQKWSRKDPTAIRKAMINPDHLEALERGELKYTCSSEDADAYGDSSADTESEEASDVEIELENDTEDNNEGREVDYVNVKCEDEEEEVGFDIEVSDLYESDDIDTEQNLLRVEMALAERELLEYEDTPSKKRSRSILEMDDEKIFEIQTGRRKTTYLVME